MSAIPLRDYLTSRPELVPAFETLRVLLRPGEEAMVSDAPRDGYPEFRVWLRGTSRTMGRPAGSLAAAIANLIGKLGRMGRVPR